MHDTNCLGKCSWRADRVVAIAPALTTRNNLTDLNSLLFRSNDVESNWNGDYWRVLRTLIRAVDNTSFFKLFTMHDKQLQAFFLAYFIGWLLSRMPSRK